MVKVTSSRGRSRGRLARAWRGRARPPPGGGGFPGVFGALALAALVLCSTRDPSSGAEPDADALPREVAVLRARADEAFAGARPAYLAALDAWGEVGTLAAKFGDSRGLERSLEARAGLAVLLSDPALFERLRREASEAARKGGSPGAAASVERAFRLEALRETGRAEPFVPASDVAPRPEALDRLRKFLLAAKSKFATLPGREERDAVALAALLALVEKASGDEATRRADALCREALSKLDALPGPRDSPRRRLARARLQVQLRDFEAARATLEAGPADFAPLPLEERKEHARLARDLARFLGDRPRYLAAVEELQRLGEKAEEPPRPGVPPARLFAASAVDLAATAQTLLGILGGYRLAEWDRAVVAYVAAAAVEELGEYALLDEILRGRGLASEEDPWLAASSASRLGFARGQLGAHEAALAALEEADRFAAGVPGTDALRARIATNQARSLLALGQLDAARERVRTVAGSVRLPADVRLAAGILLAGVLYEEAREEPGKLVEAKRAVEAVRRDLEAAKAAGEPLRDPVAIDAAASIALGNIVRTEALALDGEAAAARRARAIELEEGALRAAYAANLFDLAAIASSNVGELYLEAGKTDAAKGFVDWALARARERRLFETEWRCHWYLGRIADSKGENETADREYAKAEEVIASYRSSVLQAERKAGFLTDKVAFYRDLVRRQIRRGSPGGALSAAERAKARALVESLGLRFLAFSDPEATALYREYVLLESRAEKGRKSPPASFLGVGVKPADPAEILEKISAIRRRWERDLPRGHVLRAFLSGGSVGADEIAREVGPDATLVEYFALDDAYVALLVSEGRVEAVSLPVRPEDLARTATAFARGWADDPVAAKKLFGWLVRPIQDRIRGRKLFIVPHGPLYQVPFEALIDDAAADSKEGGAPAYLLRRFEIAYLPSASWKPLLREAGPRDGEELSLFAVQDPWTDYDGDGRPDLPPLAQAREEVAALTPYFAERVVLSGLDATKANVRERASFADVVHYACHGEFSPQRPWESSLFLAPAPGGRGGDGRLRASEVLGHDLRRSRLVALSGCETGRGRVLPGDDTVSVSTAFLHAGARALLVSLWKVEDSATALLMGSFYRKWLGEGRDKARSLREAKLELLAGEFSRPRFWSAFVLVGEP